MTTRVESAHAAAVVPPAPEGASTLAPDEDHEADDRDGDHADDNDIRCRTQGGYDHGQRNGREQQEKDEPEHLRRQRYARAGYQVQDSRR